MSDFDKLTLRVAVLEGETAALVLTLTALIQLITSQGKTS